eukprot:TRINITY_DN35354_c0_g1_i1.p1 TRINITY_DN35354_c0_g1~~TRINITY_DN35354_c0_g1_i1.p1  ORF type:complete len:410 (+),score=86.87 TRINITY_DN35354_c0_g1_i1:60-1289(+)
MRGCSLAALAFSALRFRSAEPGAWVASTVPRHRGLLQLTRRVPHQAAAAKGFDRNNGEDVEEQPTRLLPPSGSKEKCREGVKFRRLRLADGSVAEELQRAEAKIDWKVRLIKGSGQFVATSPQGQEALWQLRPPPALRALFATGACDEEAYRKLLTSAAEENADATGREAEGQQADLSWLPKAGWQQHGHFHGKADRPIGAVAVLILGAGKAALGLLRALDHKDPRALRGKPFPHRARGLWELQEHKVISTYAVRGNEKQGTGRFQLFEDARKRRGGNKCSSAGAKLRRQCAIRFFEKINDKFLEWGQELRRRQKDKDDEEKGLCRGWPPSVVFFSGDLRLRRMLLDCQKPPCPLPSDTKKLWIELPGHLGESPPSLEALQQVAHFLCTAEVAEVVDEPTLSDTVDVIQ